MRQLLWRGAGHAARLAVVMLGLAVLAACAGGREISRLPTPPDPPPVPERKPAVPPGFSSDRLGSLPRIEVPSAAPITARALPLPRRNPRPVQAPEAAPAPARKPVVETRQASPTKAAVAQARPAVVPGVNSYEVSAGENVFSIARKLNVPIRSLLEANRLGPPYKLAPGQKLIVPIPTRHIVTRGDTVYGISRRYRIDIRSLVQLNRIPPPYRISVGQVLNLPGSNNAFDAATTQLAAANVRETGAKAQTAPTPQVAPTPEVKPQVTAGETREAAVQQPARTAAPLPRAKPKPSLQPKTNPPAAVAPKATQTARAAPPKSVQRPPAGIPKPPPRASGKFLWPLQGRILSSFGSKGDGVHNDGINIEGPLGATVRAAENGVIAYAGNELRGFGRLLLIRHSDGWVTAYAHLSEVLVRRGDTVKRGQAIAKVGRTGNVTTPQLHFEIRQGTRAVDPRKLLGKQQAQR